MYNSGKGLVLGFHGCDKKVANYVVNSSNHLKASENGYDWLGHGIYFWQNSPERALQFASELKKNPNLKKEIIQKPSVVGAVLDLGFCLDLTEYSCNQELKRAYEHLTQMLRNAGKEIPKNVKRGSKDYDKIIRRLDCAVFESLHEMRHENNLPPYNSVLGVFQEGAELYDGTEFREKTHVQICIRDLNCIKGYFKPLQHFSKK
jgi:hypothetical protein